jgi:hypothetical protein
MNRNIDEAVSMQHGKVTCKLVSGIINKWRALGSGCYKRRDGNEYCLHPYGKLSGVSRIANYPKFGKDFGNGFVIYFQVIPNLGLIYGAKLPQIYPVYLGGETGYSIRAFYLCVAYPAVHARKQQVKCEHT